MSFQILVSDHTVVVFIYEAEVVLEINYVLAVLESGLDSLDQLRERCGVIWIGFIIYFAPNGVGRKMILFRVRHQFDCFS